MIKLYRFESLVLIMILLCTMFCSSPASYAASDVYAENFNSGIGSVKPYDEKVHITHVTKSGVPYEGEGCLKVETSSRNTITVPYDFEQGVRYQISFWINYKTGTPGASGISLLGSLDGKANASYINTQIDKYEDGKSVSDTVNGTWYQVKYDYTAESVADNYSVLLRAYGSNNTGADNTLYIDNFSIIPFVTGSLNNVLEDFESGLGNMSAYKSTSVDIEHDTNGNGYNSNGCMLVTADSGNTFQIPFDFTAGKTYTVSFWVKYLDTVPMKISALGSTGTATNTNVATGMPEIEVDSYADGTKRSATKLNTWYQVSFEYHAPNNTSGNYILVRLWSHDNQKEKDKKAYIDDFIISSPDIKINYVYDGVMNASFGGLDTGVLIAAAYDADDNLLSCQKKDISDLNDSTVMFELDSSSGMVSEYRLYAWDMTDVTPYCQSVSYSVNDIVYVVPDAEESINVYNTISGAKERVRELLKKEGDTIYVMLSPEEHILTEPLVFNDEDYGERKVIYTTLGDGKASISGAYHVTGSWELKDKDKKIYQTNVPKGTKSRQLFVNGVRAQRARSSGTLSDCTTDASGHTTTDTYLASYIKIKDLEMVYSSKWLHMRCGVKDIKVSGNIATITMDDAWADRYDPDSATRPKTPEYFENAYELLDEEGEWYLDEDAAKLYYKPRVFEDLNTADVVIPVTERLIDMQGTYENHIENITFDNLEFCYTTWMRPSDEKGYFISQNNTLVPDEYLDESDGSSYAQHVDAALELSNVTNVDFTNCVFDKLGTTALKMIGGVSDCDITGNEFYDNSAGAIVLGQCGYSIDHQYIVRPDKQKNPEYYYVQNNNVTNNYIRTCSVDYKSASAISLGYARTSNISNNEIYDIPYTGIHIGWGWTACAQSVLGGLRIEDNYIHNILNTEIYDGGAIYTVGGTAIRAERKADGTYDADIYSSDMINIIRGNYMVDIKNRNGPMYNDSGSEGYLWEDNVVDLHSTPVWYGNNDGFFDASWYCGNHSSPANNAIKAVNTYSTTNNTIGTASIDTEEFNLYPDANWPQEALDIIAESGITPDYLGNMGVSIQELSLTSKTVTVGDEASLSLKPKTRKGESCTAAGAFVYYESSDPSVVSVTQKGRLTAHKAGQVTITAHVITDEGILMKVQSIAVGK